MYMEFSGGYLPCDIECKNRYKNPAASASVKPGIKEIYKNVRVPLFFIKNMLIDV